MTDSSSTVRVLLADDHTLVRAGLRALVEAIPGVSVIAEAEDGHEAVRLAKEHHPDLVVMDIGMPNLNGLEATIRVRRECPATRIIILSMHSSEEYVGRALQFGASGYLLKKAAIAELQDALRQVMRGEVYLSHQISPQVLRSLAMAQREEGQARAARHREEAQGRTARQGEEVQSCTARGGQNYVSPFERLTERQRNILQLIAEGHNTKEIALDLHLSPKTVEYHRAQLMRRLQIFDIPGLVRKALQAGLTQQES
jgi:DNA-binding NarL/FixJ family response regulator